jgi:hypothetical protein
VCAICNRWHYSRSRAVHGISWCAMAATLECRSHAVACLVVLCVCVCVCVCERERERETLIDTWQMCTCDVRTGVQRVS